MKFRAGDRFIVVRENEQFSRPFIITQVLREVYVKYEYLASFDHEGYNTTTEKLQQAISQGFLKLLPQSTKPEILVDCTPTIAISF